MSFEIGAHVVCIDDKFHPSIARHYTMLPKEGVTYVIRDVRIGIRLHPKTEGDISLLLVGLNNPKANSRAALERGFSSSRFRLLDELKTRTAEPQRADKELEKVEA